MKKPLILSLSADEKKALKESVSSSDLSSKGVVIDSLEFVDKLVEELKESKISISKLRSLLGFRSERLKELLRNQEE